jgi:hypothetical protein
MKNFECDYCDYKTNRRYNLTQHMVIKHFDIKDTPICCKDTPICCKDTPQNNQCKTCNKIILIR